MMHPVLTVMQMFLPLRLPSLLQRECGGWVPSVPGHRGHHWPQVGHLGCLMFGAVSGWSRERARKWMINETLSSGFYTCARKVSPSLSLCFLSLLRSVAFLQCASEGSNAPGAHRDSEQSCLGWWPLSPQPCFQGAQGFAGAWRTWTVTQVSEGQRSSSE